MSATIRPAAASDRVAEVLPEYRAWLYRTAYDLLPDDSPYVDDLAQEGGIAMWRALGTYDPAKGGLAGWLTTAARQRMRALAWGHDRWIGHEAQRGKQTVESTVSLDAILDPEAGGDDGVLLEAAELLEGVELAYHQGEIAAALDTLSPAQRRYVVGRFWLGLDPTSRAPGMKEACALVPEMKRGSSLWLGTTGQRGARDRLAEALAHLAAA